MSDTETNEVDRNFVIFRALLPELMCDHAGKFALMHKGEVVDFFDSVADAVKFGHVKYGDLNQFSVQEVAARAESLGFHSYALHHISQ